MSEGSPERGSLIGSAGSTEVVGAEKDETCDLLYEKVVWPIGRSVRRETPSGKEAPMDVTRR